MAPCLREGVHGGALQDDLVGRAAELAAIQRAVAAGRLVTVIGVGGSGKTRLAHELTSTLDLAFAFVDLEHARDAHDIATALGQAVPSCRSAVDFEDLGRALQRDPVQLVVWDAFEHVTPLAAEVLLPLKAAAPDTRFVVTSRMPLAIRGEEVVLLSPLDIEDAWTLLTRRARAVQFDFDPAADPTSLREVVRRLDGNPLAIELAAARLSLLSPAALLGRLRDRFTVLRRATPGCTGRHTSVQAALDVTWELLASDEAAALAQCTIFVPSFTVEAAEAVLALGRTEPDGVLDVLQRLVARGLIRRDAQRLRLPDSVRDYAQHRLPAAEREDLEGRFRRFFLELTRDLSTIEGFEHGVGGQVDPALMAEVDHLAKVTQLDSSSAEERVQGAMALTALLSWIGPPARIQAVLDAVEETLPPHHELWRVRLVRARLHLAVTFRAPRPDEQVMVEAMAVAGAHGETLLQCALALNLFLRAPDRRTGEPHLAQLTQLAGADGSPMAAAFLLQARGTMAARHGSAEEALQASHEILEAEEPVGLSRLRTVWMSNHAQNLFDLGRIEDALRASDVAIALGVESDDQQNLITSVTNRVEYLVAADRVDEAQHALEQAMAVLRRTGAAEYAFRRATSYPPLFAILEGRLDEAARMLSEDLGTGWPQTNPTLASAQNQRLRACVSMLRGDDHEAIRLLSETMRVVRGSELPPRLLLFDLAVRALARARSGELEGAEDDMREATALVQAWGGLRLPLFLSLIDHALRVVLKLPGAGLAGLDALGRFTTRAPGQVPYLGARLAAGLLRHVLRDSDSDEQALLVGPDLVWVRVGSAPPIRLGRRPVMQRVMRVLIDSAECTPGRAVATETLLQEAWPDDKSMRSALTNRLWATLSKLRRAGLQDVLERVEGGYRIAAGVRVVHAPVSSEP